MNSNDKIRVDADTGLEHNHSRIADYLEAIHHYQESQGDALQDISATLDRIADALERIASK